MRWILFVVLIFGAVSWGQESKGYSDGNDLRNYCGAADALQLGYSTGYCFGLIEAFLELSPPRSLPLHCSPSGVTYGQSAKIITKYLEDHPERLHLPAISLIAEAMHRAFPCPVRK